MGDTRTLTVEETFDREQCPNCKMRFFMPSWFMRERRADRASFYCPAGHSMSYKGEPEVDRLRRELDRAKQNAAYLEDSVKHAREARDAAERRASAARGQVTRLKNRASAGVCPCCNRTFSQLARHMAAKHPTFLAEEIADGAPKH